MKEKDFYQGGYFTTLLILVTLLTVVEEQLQTWGVIAGVLIIAFLSIIVKVGICSSTKSGETTDWKAIGSYTLASSISVAITLIIALLSI